MANYTVTSGRISGPQKVVVYGPEGIGKSTFLSRFPDPLFIDTEGSTGQLDVRRLPPPSSWAMLLDEVDFVSRERPCKTLALDTADWAERLCARHVCDKAGKTGIEDFGYGKGYTYLAEEFGRLLNKLSEVLDAGIHVAVAAHAQMRKFEQPDEMGAYDRWELKLTRQCAPLLKEWAGALLFANYKTIVVTNENQKHKAQGGARVLYTAHHPCWDAKNRWGLPERVDFDYGVIAPYITGGTAPPPVRPAPEPQPAVPPQTPAPPVQPPVSAGPMAPAEPAPAANPLTEDIPASVPKELRELMAANGVTTQQVQDAVAQKGWYPPGTPFENYDPGFVREALIGGWPHLYNFILDMTGDLPF